MTIITPTEALQRTIEHREIFHDEMLSVVRMIMSGELSPVMTAALITGLRVKKETIGEITAAAMVMRELSTKVTIQDTEHLIDTCGTGGDGIQTFNVSTVCAFVAAAAGAKVALATDCNPGSSFTTSMAFCLAVAVRDMHFTPSQALVAATAGGAAALRRTDVGGLRVGQRANLVVLNAPSFVHLMYRPGVDLVHSTFIDGRSVYEREK